MTSTPSKQTILLVVLGVFFLAAGCRTGTVQSKDRTPFEPPPYVKCIGELTEYEARAPWFENWVQKDGTTVHGDGVCPRAVFRISSPTNHANREVAIMYKHSGNDLPTAPLPAEKGKKFSFEVPADFLTGKYRTIDNIHVRNVQVMP